MPNHKNRVGRTTKDRRKKQRERLAKQNQTPEDPKTGRPRNENPNRRTVR